MRGASREREGRGGKEGARGGHQKFLVATRLVRGWLFWLSTGVLGKRETDLIKTVGDWFDERSRVIEGEGSGKKAPLCFMRPRCVADDDEALAAAAAAASLSSSSSLHLSRPAEAP